MTLLAMLSIAGCTASTPGPGPAPTPSPSNERLTAEQCDRFATAYEEFQEIARTTGRSEDELLTARDELLTAWQDIAAEAAPTAGAIIELVALTFQAGMDAGFDSARYQEFLDAHDMVLEECNNVSV
ncbi:hypothetical protein Q9R08_05500 [Microbacterium sp. QXD-8]|uniref:Lipoprotein n=1 Tax=Microbacterium psychrotolerans TaxID=3068321 RepID=A0ABU0Z081_9MICO|nr:hypothetical protein [Microbacterium sp. QXD-8]MDQ7877428.1 hypothetical protein [Microbacterium sp. QXD-8]